MNVGLIGVGRLGGALARALGPAGLTLTGLIGAGDARATRLGRELGLEQVVVRTANEVLARAELVFLAVPDGAVETLCAALPWTASHAVVHTAGSLGLSALQTARTRGARVGAFHPLQSFAEGAGAARFVGIRVGIEAADAGLCAELEVLCRALGGQPLALAGVDRAGYHAAAVFASNYVVALHAAAARLFELAGLPASEALSALAPLTLGVAENIVTAAHGGSVGPGLLAALTGPVLRGDVGTVRAQLAQLVSQDAELADLYRALGRQLLGLPLPVVSEVRAALEQLFRAS